MDRWQRIEEVFLAASELPAGERAAFVEREAAGDTELLAAVTGMLRHGESGDSRFVEAVGEAAGAVAAAESLTQIDRYTILRELGRGGMGTVYLAERTDREFHQQVAIKVVKRGMDTAQIVERFRQERRMLAALDHPNIARLLDGGTTESGLPYLVMEYIEGRPLVAYCEEGQLPVRERLLLFEQVCAAVQHAHQKLIVHRDLKPANILVTPGGTPKLLDFGIAKLLSPEEDVGVTGQFATRVGTRMLTPEYASPEQIRGETVSVGTDVFSLGAVLYELLTGRRAHQFKAQTEAEYQRVICETEVKPPSEVVEDGRLRRQLGGDLDNIVTLALRRDAGRRYQSVEQLAGDIRRYLEGRPVTARAESVVYRMRKFVMRNRMPVAAATLAVLSLAAGITGTTIQARRAERRFQQVRKLANTFVFDVYDGMQDIPGTAKLRAKVVATALEYLDSLAGEADGEPALQIELAAAYKRIGDVQGNPARSGLGQMQAALSSYEKGLEILKRLAAGPNADRKVLADLAILERALGYLSSQSGDPERGLEHERRSVAAWERRNPQRGEDLEADTGIAQAWGMMGNMLLELGRAAEAVERHEAAVKLLRGWPAERVVRTTKGTISLLQYDLATAQFERGDLAGAVATYQEVMRTRQEILAGAPTNLSYRRRIFSLNFQLAAVLGHPMHLHLGEHEAAERYASEAVREAERMAIADQGSNRSVRDRMLGNWLMGCVLLPTKAREAVPYLEAALKYASIKPADGGSDVVHDDLEANALEALGRGMLAVGERARGVDLLRRAVALVAKNAKAAPAAVEYRYVLIRAMNGLGDALPAAEAAEWYRKAYEASAPFRAENPGGVRALMSEAAVHLRWGRWNAGAAAGERRRMAEVAVRHWRKLAQFAPGNRAVGEYLREAEKELAAAPR